MRIETFCLHLQWLSIMNNPDMKIPITIRLPQELVSWLGERKKLTGIPIQKTIEVALDKMKKKAK